MPIVFGRSPLNHLRRLFAGKVRRFARREDGTTAIEFGLVAAPFFALLFAIIETAMVFFAGQTLETAVSDSGRLIMTGQAQQQGFDQAAFKKKICDPAQPTQSLLTALFDCSKLVVDVRKYTNFSAAQTGKPLDAGGNLTGPFQYQPGCSGDIVVVRLMYPWPTYVSLLGLNLSDMAGGDRLLMATSAFRNEPFSSSGSC
jgi:Flp pilus assembly protein TadG